MDEKVVRGRAARPQDAAWRARRAAFDDMGRDYTDKIADRIKEVRDERGLSNGQLRDRLAFLGWELTQSALSGLLAGSPKRKNFPVHEVALFAEALDVSPWELLPFGPPSEDTRAVVEAQARIAAAIAVLTNGQEG